MLFNYLDISRKSKRSQSALEYMMTYGIIAKKTKIVLPSKISDVSVDINILDRMLKLGKVIIIWKKN